MKLVLIINNQTDTFETCILSRELSGEEVLAIHQLVGHGEERTVHIAEAGDKPIPFLDIIEELKKVVQTEIPNINKHLPGKVSSLQGVPLKHRK
jgi:hypothetical protein